MKKYKFALISCGHISYKHINTINAIGNDELAAVCDIKEERAILKVKENKIP